MAERNGRNERAAARNESRADRAERTGDRSGTPKSREESPVSPAVEGAGVTPTAPGERVPPESVPGVDTGTPAEGEPNPLRSLPPDLARPEREHEDPTPDVHSDPPPEEGLTPEDEIREEHIRRKMTDTPRSLVEHQIKGLQTRLDDLEDTTRARLARQMQLSVEDVDRVHLYPVDLNAPPVLGHKLASHDEHRVASDDDRSGADKVKQAVLEARYPVSVTQAEFEEALKDEALTDDHRIEARAMARRQEIYIRGR